MKYFFDTEFIEGFIPLRIFGLKVPTWLIKPKHSIQLISIGIVCEDGRQLYCISNEFDVKYIFTNKDTWVKDNVLKQLHDEMCKNENVFAKTYFSGLFWPFTAKSVKTLISWQGMSNKAIATEIFEFVNPQLSPDGGYNESIFSAEYIEKHKIRVYNNDYKCPYDIWRTQPEFYAYFADYDWVVFCSLFGRMLDLPKGFPFYCNDLKQSLDAAATHTLFKSSFGPDAYKSRDLKGLSLAARLKALKDYDPLYPKQENEHNAMDDALWNFKLYEYLQDYSFTKELAP